MDTLYFLHSMNNLKIELINSYDAALVEPIRSLLAQLTGRDVTFGEEELRRLVRDMSCRLFVARSDDKIVGMFSLCTYCSPSMRKVWLEDVVVDSEFRGRGIGKAMVAYAINFARQFSPSTLMLTSNPLRIEANALYHSMGLEQKKTNVYKKEF